MATTDALSHTHTHAQSSFQVRLAWGAAGLTRLAESGVVVIVDALPSVGDAAGAGSAAVAGVPATDALAARAAALPHAPTVFVASLRNAAVTAQAVYDEQISRGGRTAINLVLVGEPREGSDEAGFAVEDYLAAGAVADGLTALGIDHSAPDVAVAGEGFRSLTRALKHLLSASASGLALGAADRRGDVQAAAELNVESTATRFAH